MSGSVIQVMNRMVVDISNGSLGPPIDVTLVSAVDVSRYTEGELYVRVNGGTVGGNAVINILAYPTAPSAEDPSADFVSTSAVANISLTNSAVSSAPNLSRAVLSASAFGRALRIIARATQDSPTQTIAPEISIELVLKS